MENSFVIEKGAAGPFSLCLKDKLLVQLLESANVTS